MPGAEQQAEGSQKPAMAFSACSVFILGKGRLERPRGLEGR